MIHKTISGKLRVHNSFNKVLKVFRVNEVEGSFSEEVKNSIISNGNPQRNP